MAENGDPQNWRILFYIILCALLVGGFLIIYFSYPLERTLGINNAFSIAMRQFGVAIFIACTVGIIFSEYYRKYYNKRLRTELIDILTKSWKQQDYLKMAGIHYVFPDRQGDSVTEIKSSLSNVKDNSNIKLLGVSLRVFFSAGNDFNSDLVKLLEETDVKIQVLLLDSNSINALYRSTSETVGPFIDDTDYKKRSMQLIEIESSKYMIDSLNLKYKNKIELRFYESAPSCALFIFDDACYITQYVFGDPKSQPVARRLPTIKFKQKSEAYKQFLYHFNFIWENAYSYDEMKQSLNTKPVLNSYTRQIHQINY
jgi:hypothetical protein